MKTYKIFVSGFQIGTEELTAEEVEIISKRSPERPPRDSLPALMR